MCDPHCLLGCEKRNISEASVQEVFVFVVLKSSLKGHFLGKMGQVSSRSAIALVPSASPKPGTTGQLG